MTENLLSQLPASKLEPLEKMLERRDEEEAILDQALDAEGLSLYELFAGDDEVRLAAANEGETPWWKVLGYTSFGDWLESR